MSAYLLVSHHIYSGNKHQIWLSLVLLQMHYQFQAVPCFYISNLSNRETALCTAVLSSKSRHLGPGDSAYPIVSLPLAAQPGDNHQFHGNQLRRKPIVHWSTFKRITTPRTPGSTYDRYRLSINDRRDYLVLRVPECSKQPETSQALYKLTHVMVNSSRKSRFITIRTGDHGVGIEGA